MPDGKTELTGITGDGNSAEDEYKGRNFLRQVRGFLEIAVWKSPDRKTPMQFLCGLHGRIFAFSAFRQLSRAKQTTTRYAGGEKGYTKKLTDQLQ